MSQLTAVKTRCVTPALRLAVACAADHCRRDVLLNAGARQPTVSWRTAAVLFAGKRTQVFAGNETQALA
jgi:hypothetical protein